MQELDWPTIVGRTLFGLILTILVLRFLFLLGARSARWAENKPKTAKEKS